VAGREAGKRKGGHGRVKEVGCRIGEEGGLGGRQGRERKVTDVGWSRGQKGRQMKRRPRRSRKEDECRTKKRARLQETLGVMG
jgi:hypothetical protein